MVQFLSGYIEKFQSFYNSLDSFDMSIILLVTISAIYFYTVYLHAPDADPEILAMQGVAFPVRNPGHSQTYRNIHKPPGTNLLTGLPIRDGGPTLFRNCTMKDIWIQIPKAYNFYRSISLRDEEISVETFQGGRF